MTTISEHDLTDLLSLRNEGEKIEFGKEVLHTTCMHQVRIHMGTMKNTELARRVGVSPSFISQLFSGDKTVSLELLAKFQHILRFKFLITSSADPEQSLDETRTKVRSTRR